MNEIKRTHIKSAGLVDGKWEVILSDDSRLVGIQSVKAIKTLDSFGQIIIEIAAIDNYNKYEK